MMTVFDSISGYHLHSVPVENMSRCLASLILFSQQQADTSVINGEEVTCQWLHFSHFVLNVNYVNDSAASCSPPPPLSHQIVDFSAVSFSEEQKKDNVKQQMSSRRTDQI